MELGLRDRNVVVGGASRGIGLEIARAFLFEGARVALAARDAEALDAAIGDLGKEFEPSRVLGYVCDLCLPEEAKRFIAAAKDAWGVPHVAVANAGSGTGRAGWNLAEADWETSLHANLWPSARLAEAVLPELVAAGGGSLVFVSSIVGRERVGAPLPYSVAKAGLISYANGLAGELGEAGVRVNCVAPGNVMVSGGTWDLKVQKDPERWRTYVASEVPLRRFGRADEIADAVAFLASDRASFITGACLVIDGGQTRTI